MRPHFNVRANAPPRRKHLRNFQVLLSRWFDPKGIRTEVSLLKVFTVACAACSLMPRIEKALSRLKKDWNMTVASNN